MIDPIIIVVTGTLLALITGLLFGFSVAVNPGLRKLDDSSYVEAIRNINRAILNPVFFLSFFGPVVLLPLLAYLLRNASTAMFLSILTSAALYVIGCFAVTAAGNVPLNNKLEQFNFNQASEKDIWQARESFEGPWNRLHSIRTFASILSLIAFLCAITF